MTVLASCGGGGGSGGQPIQVNPAPSPVPSPTPSPNPSPTPSPSTTDPIIFAANGSQSFASEGRYVLTDGGISVSLDGTLGQYLVATPSDTIPRPLQRDPRSMPPSGEPATSFILPGGFFLLVRASGSSPNPTYRYLYSNLAAWGVPDGFVGVTAFGIPTQPAALPQQGSVTYSGFLEGTASERYSSEGSIYYGIADGTVSLTFDFATGMATLTITPTVGLTKDYPLPTITSAQIVLPRGSNQFHQPVFGDATNLNFPISGRLTGPAGEELVGGIRFQYVSPIDGSQQSIGAAFIAKRTGG